jgi:hypothetical protein
VTVQLNSSLTGAIGAGAAGSTVTSVSLADGAHQITAVATDLAGNTGASSAPLTVTIDTAPPAAPTALDLVSGSDNGPSDTDNITSDITPEISGNAENGSTVILTSSLSGLVGTGTGASPWTITTTSLTAGLHQLTATATDLAGNSSSGSTALAVTITNPRESKPVEVPSAETAVASSIAVSWTASSPAAAGIYDGLLRDPVDSTIVLGVGSKFFVAASGSFSGTVRLGGRAFSVRGTILPNGQLDLDVPVRGSTPLSLDLQLGQTQALGFRLRGTIAWNGTTANADLALTPFHAVTNPLLAPHPGIYTMLIPSEVDWTDAEPSGDGWARVSISTAGAVSITGVLGDGVAFTDAAYVSGALEIALHSEPYRVTLDAKLGRVGGRLVLGPVPDLRDFGGKVYWRKFANAAEPRYAAGFTLDPWVVGSKFVPPAVGARILSQLPDQEYNAELSLIGPTAPATDEESLDRVLSWKTTNTLLHYGPQSLSGTADRRNGLVLGTFYDPATRELVRFSGVAFQKQGIAAGTFVSGASSGAVRILPGASFSYPGSESPGAPDALQLPVATATPPTESPVPFTVGAAGRYDGILTGAGGSINGALESVTLTAAGAASGTLWVEGVRYAFRAVMDPSGSLSFSLARRSPLTPIVFDLDLSRIDATTDGFGFTGSVTVDTTPYTVDAQRLPVFPVATPAVQAGNYTVAVRAPAGVDAAVVPDGDGYGTMRVTSAGLCTGLVTLADGALATLSGHVGRSYDDAGTTVSEWSFHRGLYGRTPKGFVSGKLTFRTVAAISDVDGTWRWVKQAGALPTAVYPTIDVSRTVIGSRYLAPVTGRVMAGLTDDFHNIWLRFDGPNLGGPSTLDRAATWTSTNRILYFGPERVSLSFNGRNGLFSGSYRNAAGVNLLFGGALIQGQAPDLITGSFRSLGLSGWFGVEAR